MWRSRFRCISAVGALRLAIAPSGCVNSGVEILSPMSLLGFTSPSRRSKNVCHPMKRLGARKPLRRSPGSFPGPCVMSPRRSVRPRVRPPAATSELREGYMGQQARILGGRGYVKRPPPSGRVMGEREIVSLMSGWTAEAWWSAAADVSLPVHTRARAGSPFDHRKAVRGR